MSSAFISETASLDYTLGQDHATHSALWFLHTFPQFSLLPLVIQSKPVRMCLHSCLNCAIARSEYIAHHNTMQLQSEIIDCTSMLKTPNLRSLANNVQLVACLEMIVQHEKVSTYVS